MVVFVVSKIICCISVVLLLVSAPAAMSWGQKNSPPVTQTATLVKGSSLYVEVRKGELLSLCPSSEKLGNWLISVPFWLNQNNCAQIQAPNVTRSIKVLYEHEDAVGVDTAWILVEQKLIDLAKYSSFKTEWVPSTTSLLSGQWEKVPISMDKKLVIDRTEFTVEDAKFLKDLYQMRLALFRMDEYPDEDPWKHPKMPFPSVDAIEFANARSNMDGLDSVYHFISKDSFDNSIPVLWETKTAFYVVDTIASGYRLPFEYEMQILSKGGTPATQAFYWGNSEDFLSPRPYPGFRLVRQLHN